MRIAHVMGGSLEPGARGGVCDVCGTERPCVRLVRLVHSRLAGDVFVCHVCEDEGRELMTGDTYREPCEYCEDEGGNNEDE